MINFFDLRNKSILKFDLKMRLTTLLLFLTLLNIGATTYSQNTKFTFNLKNVTVYRVFEEIKNNSEFNILHATNEIDLQRLVSIKVKHKSINTVLKQLFLNTPVVYKIVDKQIVLSLKKEKSIPIKIKKVGKIYSDKKLQNTISGTVKDANGTPLPDVNITIEGTAKGTKTDFDGNFTIEADKGQVLIFSYIGMQTQKVTVADTNTIDVVLIENLNSLGEIVVIGYGKSVRKEDLTGAVSMIGTKDIEKTPLTNVDQAIQGRASGIQLIQASGAPGAGFKIRVRGSNSITGNNDPLVVVDGLIGVGINSVNPSDIQSVSILKDASSTAIYGNRGANGVVIITTKKGTAGKSTIEFGSYVSFSNPLNKLDLLSPAEFIDFANTKNIGAGAGPIPVFDTQDKIDNAIANAVDYQDALYRTATTQNYSLAFRGGSEKMNYYLSANYLDQDGLALNTNFKRYALRSNISADISDKLSVISTLNLIRQNGFNNSPQFGERLGIGGVGFDPVTPIFDENGNYNNSTTVLGGVQSSVIINPVFLAKESKLESIADRMQANLSLNYNLAKNLDFNVSGGVNNAKFLGVDFNPAGSSLGSPIRARQGSVNRTRWQYAFKLTYDNTFNEKHKLSLTAIAENRGSKQRGFNATGVGFFTNLEAFNLGIADLQTISSSFARERVRSFIGRGIYNYDSKYLVTATIRHDRSSVFPINQTKVYPSFALGWNINNESFFTSETISLLRLRGGWGQTGNDRVPTNAALDLYRDNPWIPNGGSEGTPAILPGLTLANPDLTWETTTQTNIGLDLGIINNKFNLSLEYYNKKTSDLLLSKKVAGFTGKQNQFVNAGEVENKGIDISLSGTPVSTDNFSWNFNVNFTRNKNEVIKLVDGLDIIFPDIRLGNSNALTANVIKVGESIGSFFGFVFEGVDTTNGNAIYADDRKIIGDPNPDFTYGINNTITYKNFDLNFFFQGVQGNDIFNVTRSLLIGRSGDIPFGLSTELRNTWTATNTSAPLPSLNATNTQLLSSEFVEDGSYIRLKNISLGYTLNDSNLLKTIGGESLRFYISGQNVFTITDYSGIDPEISSGRGFDGSFNDAAAGIDAGAYPLPRTFTLGLNFKF